MISRVLIGGLTLLSLVETSLATSRWSAPYIRTPLEYQNLTFPTPRTSLERRRVWDDVGHLASRQLTCDDPGYSLVCADLFSPHATCY